MSERINKALKSTVFQMVVVALGVGFIVFIISIIPTVIEYSKTVNPWFFRCAAFIFIALCWYSYNVVRYTPVSTNWITNKNESVPTCKLIHAEVRTNKGGKKMLWRKRPSDLDFTDSAEEPVICYLVVKN